MINKLFAAAILASTAASASAATFVFQPGSGALQPGETVVYNFNDPAADSLVTGTNFRFLTGTSGDGARPITGDGSRYLSVLTNGTASLTFAQPAFGFSADFGSVDTYNTVTLNFVGGATQSFTGSQLVANANGSQTSPNTNGRFVFLAGAGERIAGVTFSSAGNSFEIDRLATNAVPEPATWAMMIGGFGLIGFASRRTRGRVSMTLA
jgi:plastocyanin